MTLSIADINARLNEIGERAAQLGAEGKLSLDRWVAMVLEVSEIAPGTNSEFLWSLMDPSWEPLWCEAMVRVDAERRAGRPAAE